MATRQARIHKRNGRIRELADIALETVPSGIRGLDQVTHGGFPKGRTALVCRDSGAGKTLLGFFRFSKARMDVGVIPARYSRRSQCEEHLHGIYSIQVIDLLERPVLAGGDQIIAVPTLVRWLPTPVKKIIGELSNTQRMLVGLDLTPAGGWH